MIYLDNFSIGKLSQRTAWVGASKSVGFLTLFAANIYLARTLTQKNFGLYQQGWLFIHTFVPILLLGIPQALSYLLPPASGEKSRQYIHAFFSLLFLTGLATCLLTLLLPKFMARVVGNPELYFLIPVIGLYTFLILPFNLMEPIFILKNRVRELFLWALFFNLLFLSIIFWGGQIQSLEMIFIALALLALLKMIIVILRTLTLYGPGTWHISFDLWSPLFKYLGILAGISVVDVLTVEIDKYVVSHFLGAERYALYSVGAMEIPVLALLISSVTAVMMPEMTHLLSENKKEEVIRLLHRSMEKLAIVIFPLCFYCVLTAGFYLPFFFGDRYKASLVVFYIYLVLVPIRVLNNHPYLISGGLQRYALYARLLDIAINFALGIFLIRRIGLLGPAIATVLASYIHKAYQTAIVGKHLGLKLDRIYPWKPFFRILWRAGLCSLCLGTILHIFGSSLIPVLIGSVVFAGMYLILVPRLLKQNQS